MGKLAEQINSTLEKIVSMASSSSNGVEIGSVNINTPHHLRFSCVYFSGTKIRGILADAGNIIIINYSLKVEKGEIKIQILGPDNAAPIQLTAAAGTSEIKALMKGTYRLVVTGVNARGLCDISWSVK
jgi:hypothetical protein